MAKKIRLQNIDSGVTAVATLLEVQAPRTCEALWSALAKPLEAKMLHGIWTGRTLEIGVPARNQTFDPASIPRENATLNPIPGELLWKYFLPGEIRGLESPAWCLMIIYGPEALMRTPAGPAAANVWAHITENLSGFCEDCARLWFGKAEHIHISRWK